MSGFFQKILLPPDLPFSKQHLQLTLTLLKSSISSPSALIIAEIISACSGLASEVGLPLLSVNLTFAKHGGLKSQKQRSYLHEARISSEIGHIFIYRSRAFGAITMIYLVMSGPDHIWLWRGSQNSGYRKETTIGRHQFRHQCGRTMGRENRNFREI